jgi:raffinose/stachyose/melibiose transport system permease protein
MRVTSYRGRTLARELVLIGVAIVYCLPFYLLVAVALESTSQSYKAPLSFPWPPHLGNFSTAWTASGQAGLGRAFMSSAIITVSSVVGLITCGSLCAYAIARRSGRLSDVLYLAFVIGIILPVNLAIIPLFVVMRHLGLVGSYAGMILLNIGLLMPVTVFLYTGFIRALPRDYEEAARVDGAGLFRTYARVVLPLLAPITGTVAVLVGIAVWNEFFITLIFLIGSKYETLPVALYSYAGEYGGRWNLMLAGVTIALVPALAFYLFAQRTLIRGIAAWVRS